MPENCAHCGQEIPEPVGGNSTLIEQVPPEVLKDSEKGSWNACIDIWYKLGFKGKRICRECFWK